jgi:hypothetical protein
MQYISILSTVICFVFAASVLNRYRYRKGTHLLYWGIGLVMFGLATLSEIILAFSYSPLALKTWFLFGAMLTAAWLGQGTVFLLVRKPGIARGMAIGLIVLSLVATFLVFITPVNASSPAYNLAQSATAQYQQILAVKGWILVLTILLNTYGLITLVGGAIYSAFLFWRKRVLVNRVVGNILIAAGALVLGAAGSLARAGLADWVYISNLLGIILMYVGFLQATASRPVEKQVSPAPVE